MNEAAFGLDEREVLLLKMERFRLFFIWWEDEGVHIISRLPFQMRIPHHFASGTWEISVSSEGQNTKIYVT